MIKENHSTVSRVRSTTYCKSGLGVKMIHWYFKWGLVAKDLPGSVVEFTRDCAHE